MSDSKVGSGSVGLVECLSPEQRKMLARWPKGEGFTYGGPNSFYGSVGPDPVAQSLVDIGYAVIMPWKHGTQLGLKGAGLSAHLALTTQEKPS